MYKTVHFEIEDNFNVLGLGRIKCNNGFLSFDFDHPFLSEIIEVIINNTDFSCYYGDDRLQKCGFVLDGQYYVKYKIKSGPIYIGNVRIDNRVCLAPMAGICNEAYRCIVKEMGVGLIYAEMVSDKALNFQNNKTLGMLKVNPYEHPISMQVFGSDLDILETAAKMINESEADIIDINMGCPVSKVAKKSGAGSALLKNPELVYQIVKRICDVATKPVTVKIRSGWDFNSINAPEIAQLCEKAGASAIAIHPRTRSQLYTGLSDWRIIREVKKSVSIPVIGNGDIKCVADARRMMEETGCDMVMIGRAGLGNPWLFKNICSYFKGEDCNYTPSLEEIREMIHRHTLALENLKCEKVAILEMRNHAAWYIKGLPEATSVKKELYKCKTKDDLFTLIDNYFDNLIIKNNNQ